MAFPQCEIYEKEKFKGEGFDYGGGFTILIPIIDKTTSGSRSVLSKGNMIVLDIGDDNEETAKFMMEAINEKLERDFRHGGGS